MPNLRDIKARIKSIQNTQKITQAMKLVAAAKVKKAENAVKAARPFTEEIINVFKRALMIAPPIEHVDLHFKHALDNYPELLDVRPIKSAGLLVITSDKGLAGSYNANVVRKTQHIIEKNSQNNIATKLFIVGTKGVSALRMFLRGNNNYDAQIVKTYTKLSAIPTVGSAHVISEDLAECFVSKHIDEVEIITTKFKSMLSYQAESWQILPVVMDKKQTDEKKQHAQMLFEPNVETVLKKAVPLYISNNVYQAMLEASASELAARMSAMSSATNNASDMINNLTIIYNKARQAAITQEISEVVSGANALE
ncbi:MAG: ATP synthase F1 subunit gamma [Candidatus Gastranaerophilales bacterium]|nr:ATP synthase F1 subunit gamma [Candidatus Gastranaerophilales bacterium]